MVAEKNQEEARRAGKKTNSQANTEEGREGKRMAPVIVPHLPFNPWPD